MLCLDRRVQVVGDVNGGEVGVISQPRGDGVPIGGCWCIQWESGGPREGQCWLIVGDRRQLHRKDLGVPACADRCRAVHNCRPVERFTDGTAVFLGEDILELLGGDIPSPDIGRGQRVRVDETHAAAPALRFTGEPQLKRGGCPLASARRRCVTGTNMVRIAKEIA